MIYFDNAATTFPKPPQVFDAVAAAIRLGNPGRGSYKMALCAAEEAFLCRKYAAELFDASADRVIFTQNTTYALNLAIKGAAKDGAILISDLEHNAVLRPAMAAASGNVRFFDSAVELWGSARKEAILDSIRANCHGASVLVCTAASNICGADMPIREIGEFCRERGIFFIVDGAQACGTLPIRVREYGIGALCLPGHKGLYGPMGVGMLILGEDVSLPTLIEGGSGIFSKDLTMPEQPPERYEAGTLPMPAIAGLRCGMEFVASRKERIRAHEERLAMHLKCGLGKLTNVRLYAPHHRGGIVLFSVDGIPSEDVAEQLERHGFAVRAGLHCAPLAHKRLGSDGAVRVSFGAFNIVAETDAFVRALEIICKMPR